MLLMRKSYLSLNLINAFSLLRCENKPITVCCQHLVSHNFSLTALLKHRKLFILTTKSHKGKKLSTHFFLVCQQPRTMDSIDCITQLQSEFEESFIPCSILFESIRSSTSIFCNKRRVTLTILVNVKAYGCVLASDHLFCI